MLTKYTIWPSFWPLTSKSDHTFYGINDSSTHHSVSMFSLMPNYFTIHLFMVKLEARQFDLTPYLTTTFEVLKWFVRVTKISVRSTLNVKSNNQWCKPYPDARTDTKLKRDGYVKLTARGVHKKHMKQEKRQCDKTRISTIQPSVDMTGIRNETWQ